MTKSKKSIVMHGTLLCPLVLGHCAFLRANGTTYRTSTVVAIHEQSADMIHFETLNSDYYLSMDPFPMAAVFPAYTAVAGVFVCRGLFYGGIRWKSNPKPLPCRYEQRSSFHITAVAAVIAAVILKIA